ncbi:hypothetical protein ASZ78_000074 [Callipepla squamata]|uniref:All trans-polyprenyl-diphosphate synthase PDSS1 n=1 Tax=Callipepla squamata TaxID=9009 RepID=A0A226MNV5_CALSU|nr:hypothetical protein ASZ78_000074 [Callipepla squamata]
MRFPGRLRKEGGGCALKGFCLWNQGKLAFDNVTLLKNTVTRFYHTSTAHMCSCSKTVSDEKFQDPFQLGRKDLKNLYEDIKKELLVSTAELREMCEYYFDGKGKAFRPMIVVLMARACNIHHSNSREVQASQRSVAIIAEMIHTASLVHDDVIDDANSRRGKMTVNQIWGERKAVLAGDFILSAASLALARIGNTTIISVLTQVIEDLVRGEFLQLGSKENENERFAHYLEKTFKKTASLIANSCKAVSILGCPDPKVHEIAYQYGKNVGIAFQLIDDVLDFTSCADHLGKPAAADLKLGLATGPVLFACRQVSKKEHFYPKPKAYTALHSHTGTQLEHITSTASLLNNSTHLYLIDEEWATFSKGLLRYPLHFIFFLHKSDGVQQTTYLAQRYCHEATREISKLRPSPEREALIQLTEMVLVRDK